MDWERERERVLSMTPEELFEYHKRMTKRDMRRTAILVAIAIAQFTPVFFMARMRHRMEKVRDETIAWSAKTAVKVDQLTLRFTKMQEACGIARGIKRD